MGKVQLEDLIEQTGGCGRYQVLLCFIVHSMKCIVCFSMVFMVFGAAAPNWWCIDETVAFGNGSSELRTGGAGYKSCTGANETVACSKFIFEDSMQTLVTQWNLVCDRAWIPSTVTSIQMAGVLVGNLACGQVADLIGRKPPLFLSLTALVVLNGIAAFSVSWIMFAVLRFFIGLAMGFELTVQYNVMAEFTQARWRTWVVAVPSWAIQLCLFALVSWSLRNWKHIHLATAAVGAPLLASYWFVPESFRWYVGHNRTADAEKIIKKIAKFNKRTVPDLSDLYVLNSDDEVQARNGRKYSFVDLLKEKDLLKLSLILIFVWFTLGLGGYGIQFGVQALSGNLYVNIFLLGLIGSPIQFLVIALQNRYGRKKVAILFYVLCAATAFTVAVAYRFSASVVRNNLANISALLSLTAINAAWSPIQTLTIETYPTVVRNIGFGLQNTVARVGAIIGPQLAFLDTMVSGILYWICGVATLVSVVCVIAIPETRFKDLTDKLFVEVNIEADDIDENRSKEKC